VQEALTSLKDQHQKDLLHAWSIRQIDQGRRQLPNDHSSRSRKDDGFLHKSGERCRFWSADNAITSAEICSNAEGSMHRTRRSTGDSLKLVQGIGKKLEFLCGSGETRLPRILQRESWHDHPCPGARSPSFEIERGLSAVRGNRGRATGLLQGARGEDDVYGIDSRRRLELTERETSYRLRNSVKKLRDQTGQATEKKKYTYRDLRLGHE
ncbi:hypothetical protein X777_03517, partial [Ooceraea biroi]